MKLIIKTDDLTGAVIADFLEEHINEMKDVSPPESKHALDLDGLRKPDITFWSVWHQDNLVGCGAVRELDRGHGEVKSMRTARVSRGRGIASAMLRHILMEAKARGYRRLSLETGSMPYFAAARSLYLKFGFQVCAPFADYSADPNSVFMTLEL